jgi:hypothetical protein
MKPLMGAEAENIQDVLVNLADRASCGGGDYGVVQPLHAKRPVNELGNEPRIRTRQPSFA